MSASSIARIKLAALTTGCMIAAGALTPEAAPAQTPPHVIPPAPAPIRFVDPELDREYHKIQAAITAEAKGSMPLANQAYDAIAAAEADPIGSPKWMDARDAVYKVLGHHQIVQALENKRIDLLIRTERNLDSPDAKQAAYLLRVLQAEQAANANAIFDLFKLLDR